MLRSWCGGVGGQADGVGYGKGRRGGHTMTLPPSYATTSWSSVASPQWWRGCKVVRGEVGEGHGASGSWRWNSSTMAGAGTSFWGGTIFLKLDTPITLPRTPAFPPPTP